MAAEVFVSPSMPKIRSQGVGSWVEEEEVQPFLKVLALDVHPCL
jgi:hypothetical protein